MTRHLEKSMEPLVELENVRLGQATSHNHFGEYLQAYFSDLPDVTDRAAISVPIVSYEKAVDFEKRQFSSNIQNEALKQFPLAHVGSASKFTVTNKSLDVEVVGKNFEKSKNAALLTLKYLNKSEYGGVLEVKHHLPEGYGLGTSTSDVLSAINAVANSFFCQLTNAEIAQIALDAEGACDAIMYDRAGLFITTKCKFLDFYDVAFPAVMILGLDFGKESVAVDTLTIPVKEYTREEKEKYNLLRKAAGHAFLKSDINMIGQIATQSALLNQRFLPKPHLEEVIKIAQNSGGSGVVCAHSGSIVGIMYDYLHAFSGDQVQTLVKDLESIGVQSLSRFYSS